MKDCTNCPKRPPQGSDYHSTACYSCRPWEPQDDQRTQQMTHEQAARLPDNNNADDA